MGYRFLRPKPIWASSKPAQDPSLFGECLRPGRSDLFLSFPKTSSSNAKPIPMTGRFVTRAQIATCVIFRTNSVSPKLAISSRRRSELFS